jgi:hypothetical protein
VLVHLAPEGGEVKVLRHCRQDYGRRLYETMAVWETDPSLRRDALRDAFADAWCARPKVVFSRTLDSVQGNARLARGSLAEEVAATVDATDGDVSIGGAGTPLLPPVTDEISLDLIETRTFGSRVVFQSYTLHGRGREWPRP